MRARDRLKFFDAFEFAVERPVVREIATINDLYRAMFAENISRQPDLAIAAAADAAEELVVRNRWWIAGGPRTLSARGTNVLRQRRVGWLLWLKWNVGSH